MTKNIMKIVAILLAIVFVVAFAGSTFASVSGGKGASSDDYDVKQFDTFNDDSGAKDSVANIIGSLISIIQVIGTGVAIIMLLVLAIKYISASPGDKADIKKHAVVYVVGSLVLFAASAILGIIKNFSRNIQATSAT